MSELERVPSSSRKLVVSYCRRDMKWLERFLAALKQVLIRCGAEVFHDRKIPCGVDWQRELLMRFANAQVAFVLLSEDYNGSEWCLAEYNFLEARERSGGLKLYLIPLTPLQTNFFQSQIRFSQDGKSLSELAQISEIEVQRYFAELAGDVADFLQGPSKNDPRKLFQAVAELPEASISSSSAVEVRLGQEEVNRPSVEVRLGQIEVEQAILHQRLDILIKQCEGNAKLLERILALFSDWEPDPSPPGISACLPKGSSVTPVGGTAKILVIPESRFKSPQDISGHVLVWIECENSLESLWNVLQFVAGRSLVFGNLTAEFDWLAVWSTWRAAEEDEHLTKCAAWNIWRSVASSLQAGVWGDIRSELVDPISVEEHDWNYDWGTSTTYSGLSEPSEEPGRSDTWWTWHAIRERLRNLGEFAEDGQSHFKLSYRKVSVYDWPQRSCEGTLVDWTAGAACLQGVRDLAPPASGAAELLLVPRLILPVPRLSRRDLEVMIVKFKLEQERLEQGIRRFVSVVEGCHQKVMNVQAVTDRVVRQSSLVWCGALEKTAVTAIECQDYGDFAKVGSHGHCELQSRASYIDEWRWRFNGSPRRSDYGYHAFVVGIKAPGPLGIGHGESLIVELMYKALELRGLLLDARFLLARNFGPEGPCRLIEQFNSSGINVGDLVSHTRRALIVLRDPRLFWRGLRAGCVPINLDALADAIEMGISRLQVLTAGDLGPETQVERQLKVVNDEKMINGNKGNVFDGISRADSFGFIGLPFAAPQTSSSMMLGENAEFRLVVEAQEVVN